MPVYCKTAHAAAPGCRRIDFPPIPHDRRLTLTLESRVRGIRISRGLSPVPCAITQYWYIAGVLAEVGFPMQLWRIQPAIIARLQSIDPVIDAVTAIIIFIEAFCRDSRSPYSSGGAITSPVRISRYRVFNKTGLCRQWTSSKFTHATIQLF